MRVALEYFVPHAKGKKHELIRQLADLLRQPGNVDKLRSCQQGTLDKERSCRHCKCLLPAALKEVDGQRSLVCARDFCGWKEVMSELQTSGTLLCAFFSNVPRCSFTSLTTTIRDDCTTSSNVTGTTYFQVTCLTFFRNSQRRRTRQKLR